MIQHKELASGKWAQLSLLEQMANIGSEVERALNWKKKNNLQYSILASDRALELIDLSLDVVTDFSRLKEIARLRETLVDFFYGENEYASNEDAWRKYFLSFTLALKK